MTNISVEITGIPKELFSVIIREIPDEDFAVGGVTVKELKERLKKQSNGNISNQINIKNMNGRKFAEKWIISWNSHNLDDILSHYSEDIEITTPMIK